MPQAALTAAGDGVRAKTWARQRLMGGGGGGPPPEPLASRLARLESDNEDLKRRVSRLEAQAAPAGDWQAGGWAGGADTGPDSTLPKGPDAGQQGLGTPLVSDARGSAYTASVGDPRAPSSPAGGGGIAFVVAGATGQAPQAQPSSSLRQGLGAGRPAGSAWSGGAAPHREERSERASRAAAGGAEVRGVQQRVQQQWLVEQVHNVMADPRSTAAAGATEDISADAANQVRGCGVMRGGGRRGRCELWGHSLCVAAGDCCLLWAPPEG